MLTNEELLNLGKKTRLQQIKRELMLFMDHIEMYDDTLTDITPDSQIKWRRVKEFADEALVILGEYPIRQFDTED